MGVAYNTISLAERIRANMKTMGLNITQQAEALGVSRPLLTQYINGKYPSNPQTIEQSIRQYLGDLEVDSDEGHFQLVETRKIIMEKREGFFESKDARNVLAVCAACQRHAEFGLVLSESGKGKTFAFTHYAKLDRVAYIRGSEIMGIRDMLREMGTAMGLPRSYGSNYQQIKEIAAFCQANPGYLLIVDEADKLLSKHSQKKIEALRDLFDMSSVGIVLGGEPKLAVLVKTYLERLAKRIVYHTELQGISTTELKEYLSGYNIDPDAYAELKYRACTGKGSCFRILDRTLDRVFDLIKETGGSTITLKIIEQACAMMVV